MPALFDELVVNVPLAQTVLAGGYSIVIRGEISGEPKSCGQLSATTILQFA